jgi:hypothetical protein
MKTGIFYLQHMNWKIKLVLLFAKLRKPIDANSVTDIKSLRKNRIKRPGSAPICLTITCR